MKTADDQALDDQFRDKLLGTVCFCGAGDARSMAYAPLKCLAFGYCEAHSTPVAAQMSTDDKFRLVDRCGIKSFGFPGIKP